ncbi:50S ribosomal protein L25 [Stomatohabitans albus]|uniref:50S ribosomal protein L25 n=1 Tax=Stomatohabitans albus TaxID=3110766 RepID=UPI00300DA52F
MAHEKVTLEAQPRQGAGKSEARKLRAKGRVPINVYGHGLDHAVALHVDRLELNAALNTSAGMNVVVHVLAEGEDYVALPREIQRHPVRRDVLHLDFITFDRKSKVNAEVPITVLGEVEDGNVTQELVTLLVDVLPMEMIDEVTVDVTGMEVGDVIRVADIVVPEGVDVLLDEEQPVLSIVADMVLEEEPVEGEESEAAEGEEGDAAEDSDAADGEEG